jgi:hypothetical protein
VIVMTPVIHSIQATLVIELPFFVINSRESLSSYIGLTPYEIPPMMCDRETAQITLPHRVLR